MANGDVIATKNTYRHVKLLDALVATDDGEWIDTHGYDQASIEVSGITTATVLVCASNAAAKPANSSHGVTRTTFSADGESTYTVLPRWIKARISAWTSGTVSAIIVLRRSGGIVVR